VRWYLFGIDQSRLDPKIVQTLLPDESTEENIPELRWPKGTAYIKPGCGASDLGPSHGERSR